MKKAWSISAQKLIINPDSLEEGTVGEEEAPCAKPANRVRTCKRELKLFLWLHLLVVVACTSFFVTQAYLSKSEEEAELMDIFKQLRTRVSTILDELNSIIDAESVKMKAILKMDALETSPEEETLDARKNDLNNNLGLLAKIISIPKGKFVSESDLSMIIEHDLEVTTSHDNVESTTPDVDHMTSTLDASNLPKKPFFERAASIIDLDSSSSQDVMQSPYGAPKMDEIETSDEVMETSDNNLEYYGLFSLILQNAASSTQVLENSTSDEETSSQTRWSDDSSTEGASESLEGEKQSTNTQNETVDAQDANENVRKWWTDDDDQIQEEDVGKGWIPDDGQIQEEDVGKGWTPDDGQIQQEDVGEESTADDSQIQQEDVGEESTVDDAQIQEEDLGKWWIPDDGQIQQEDVGKGWTADDSQIQEEDVGKGWTPDDGQIQQEDVGEESTVDDAQVQKEDVGKGWTEDDDRIREEDVGKWWAPDDGQIQEEDLGKWWIPDDGQIQQEDVGDESTVDDAQVQQESGSEDSNEQEQTTTDDSNKSVVDVSIDEGSVTSSESSPITDMSMIQSFLKNYHMESGPFQSSSELGISDYLYPSFFDEWPYSSDYMFREQYKRSVNSPTPPTPNKGVVVVPLYKDKTAYKRP
ncbi:unnamed protein product [Xylocopa violacea]|uniref:Uncharacterized protein n=1 Tax=Xylocopa violacea TaxID=135666 RepID=A0ABP1NZE5_XYLVO